jgi:hypothetical protein
VNSWNVCDACFIAFINSHQVITVYWVMLVSFMFINSHQVFTVICNWNEANITQISVKGLMWIHELEWNKHHPVYCNNLMWIYELEWDKHHTDYSTKLDVNVWTTMSCSYHSLYSDTIKYYNCLVHEVFTIFCVMLASFQFINLHQSFYGILGDAWFIPIHKFTSCFVL